MKTTRRSQWMLTCLMTAILLAGGTLSCNKDQNSGQKPEWISSVEELNRESRRLYDTGDYEGALEKRKAELAIYEKIPQSEELQTSCRKTIQALERIIELKKGAKNPRQELEKLELLANADVLDKECDRLMKEGDYEGALDKGKAGLAIYEKLPGTEELQAAYRDKIQAIERVVEVKKKLGTSDTPPARLPETPTKTANDLLDAGFQSYGRGDAAGASDAWSKALRAFQDARGTEPMQAFCSKVLGYASEDMGRFEEAILRQEQALVIYKTIQGAEKEQAGCYTNIGVALGHMGKHEAAIQNYERALAVFRTVKDSEREQAICSSDIGSELNDMGRYEEAIHCLERALMTLKTIEGAGRDQASCLMNIGISLEGMGKYDEAVQRQEQALAIFKTIDGAELRQAKCWGLIGEAQRAAKQFSEAIAAYEKVGRTPLWVSRGLGLAYSQRRQPGDEEMAEKQFLEAVHLAEGRRSLVLASENRAGVFEEPSQVFRDFVGFLSELDSRKDSAKAPALAQWAVDNKSESVALTAAFHYADQGKGRSLEDALREKSVLKAVRPDTKLLTEDRELSLRISKLTSLREPLPETDTERRKKLTEEIESLQQRHDMIEVELKKTALGGYVAPDFRKPMEMAKELEPDRAVLQYSVGEKDGWLLILTREGITAHKLGAATPALPELLPRQEPTLSQLADAWNKRADKIGLDGLVRLARARAEDLARPGSPVAVPVADDLLTRTKEPPRQEARRHNLVGAEQEKAILGRLAEVALPDAALAELRKKGIHRLLVIPDGSLHYVPFAMLRLKNEKDAGTHYLVEEFASSYIPAMTTLNTIRKQKQEREKKRPMERRPLLAFANPAYGAENLPSAPPTAAAKDDMLTRLRSFRADNYKNAGLRLTSLPETEQEATRVASLFAPPKTYNKLTAAEPGDQAVVFTGRGACEEEVKQLLAASVDPKARRQWQYVLFSTHGLADTYNGMLSCLALSSPVANSVEDGFLQAQEVMNLEFDADLVMLSACQTGLGRLRGGEGLVGLCAAFFYAGAESVCASLWQVPSGPTSQLVPEFFKRLKEGKVDRSEALRQAQLQVLRQGQGSDGKPTDYSTPFCWAAFVLMGEHR